LWLSNLPSIEKHNRIYLALASIEYLLRAFIPSTDFNRKLINLLDKYPDLPLYYMGFTKNWKDEEFWKK
jgi:hypothetical protein